MRSFMGFQARRELLLQTRTRYCEAAGQAKTAILDEFVLATGYDRKYAIRLLNGAVLLQPTAIKRPRAHKYGSTIQESLAIAWAATNCICTKRLVPFLPELIPLLEHHGHLVLTQENHDLLMSVSAATADRLLRTSRRGGAGGLSTTKPGVLLKHQIPLRTFSDWEDARVGFFEVDLVAHCGTSIAGTFLWSLVMTDIASGWTECFALLRRNGKAVVRGLRHIQQELPFPILGIDTDNGTEFINDDVVQYCKTEQVTFTRGRAYRKNDQCFVEQKNGSIVRQTVGYDRYDGQLALQQLSELYRALRLYVNFYQPSMKLKTKSRDGSKVHRTYSPAQTPFQRISAANVLLPAVQEKLDQLRKSLDPVMLLRLLQAQQDALWRYAILAVPTGKESDPPVSFEIDACLPKAPGISPARKYRRSPKSRRDLFKNVDDLLYGWFLASPETSVKGLLRKLQLAKPNTYSDASLRSLYRKVRRWRASAEIISC